MEGTNKNTSVGLSDSSPLGASLVGALSKLKSTPTEEVKEPEVLKQEEKKVEEVKKEEVIEEPVAEEKKTEEPVIEEIEEPVEEPKAKVRTTFYEALGSVEGIDVESYDNNLQGVARMAEDVAEVKGKNLATSLFKETMEVNPTLAAFYKHSVLEGKSEESFFMRQETPDYAKIDLADEEGQKAMIQSYYKDVKGLSNSDALSMTELTANKGSEELKSVAERVKVERDTLRGQELKAREDQEALAHQQQELDNNKLLGEIDDVIKTRKIGSLSLTEKEAKEFKSQVLNSDADKAYRELDLEEQLLIDYLVINKGKIKGLFESKAKVKKEETLDSLFEQNKKRDVSIKDSKKDKGSGSPLDADISHLGGLNMKSLFTNKN